MIYNIVISKKRDVIYLNTIMANIKKCPKLNITNLSDVKKCSIVMLRIKIKLPPISNVINEYL